MTSPLFSLQQIAATVGGRVDGDAEFQVSGLGTLENAQSDQLSLYTSSRYKPQLTATSAGAVLIKEDDRALAGCHAIVVPDPYAAFAQLTHLFDRNVTFVPGIHPSAVIDDTARIADDVQICANVVIGADTVLESGCYVGANTVVGERCVLAEGCRLNANVTLYNEVRLGRRVLIHSGAVLGADGFGFAPHEGRWFKIAQLGAVVIEDDVEIGACTTVDRGAVDDTVIREGAKLDNHIMVAHNVEIGEHSALAAMVGIAGSTKVGKGVRIAGAAGIAGHLTIADNSYIGGMAMVTKSINEAGAYASGIPLEPTAVWRRNVVRFRQLDKLAGRVKELEEKFKEIEGHS